MVVFPLLASHDQLGLAFLSPDHLPLNVLSLRNQEYGADELAVKITSERYAAISYLKKLAGRRLNSASHSWEFMRKQMPAMTMRARIARFLP